MVNTNRRVQTNYTIVTRVESNGTGRPTDTAGHTIYAYREYRLADVCMDIHTLRPRQNGRHFLDNIFKCIFMNENV